MVVESGRGRKRERRGGRRREEERGRESWITVTITDLYTKCALTDSI